MTAMFDGMIRNTDDELTIYPCQEDFGDRFHSLWCGGNVEPETSRYGFLAPVVFGVFMAVVCAVAVTAAKGLPSIHHEIATARADQ